MAEGQKSPQAQNVTKETSLLDQIVTTMSGKAGAEQKAFARDAVSELAKQALEGTLVFSGDTERTLKLRIAQLDEMISKQLNEVMHAPSFQKLEATWRGIQYLVEQTPGNRNVKVKLLNVRQSELQSDLKNRDFVQSQTWKKVYDEEFGVFGGDPFGLLVGDFQFSNEPQDVEILERMATIAAAAHAPFISSASPQLLGLDSFTQIGEPKSIPKLFESQAYAKWNSFRESEDSRFVGLVAPRMLLRSPYTAADASNQSFSFDEVTAEHDEYLWGNSAFAFAGRVTNSFSEFGWCTAIRGVEGGGLVEGLPTHTFKTDRGDVAMKCPTEVAITEARDKELSDAGIMSLVHCKGRDYAAFFGAQSVNKPREYSKPDATANAKLSSQLQYLFATCRFAHYLKAIMRDKIGGFMSRKNAEDYLKDWIAQYVLMDDDASPGMKAKQPLREADVTVEEIPGHPGTYRAVAYLRPHFQLEQIDVSLRLVADLPRSAA